MDTQEWHAECVSCACMCVSKSARAPQLSLMDVFLSWTELRSTGTAHHFAYLLNTSDYRILRMDEDHDRMYVGSKDHILSLDLHDINKDPHIVRPFPCPASTHPKFWSLRWAVASSFTSALQQLPPRAKCSAPLPQQQPFWWIHIQFLLAWAFSSVRSLKHCNWVMTIPARLILAWVDIPFAILVQKSYKCQWCITSWIVTIKCPRFPPDRSTGQCPNEEGWSALWVGRTPM